MVRKVREAMLERRKMWRTLRMGQKEEGEEVDQGASHTSVCLSPAKRNLSLKL